MAQIRIDIASEFKEKGFKQADKASTMLDKKFKALAKTFVAVFSVRQILAFGRASVNAFAEAEKEAAQLRSQLTGINLAFATPVVDEYIDKLELATGLTGGQLVPAFNSLSRATEDITNAQELLNLALDISFATGNDLNRVSGALQRAYKGEVTALARLRLGYTTAELKGKKFEKVIKELERRFSGSTERATEGYGTSVNRLKRAFEQAQESIGKGFVSGLEKSGKSIEDFQDDIKDLGFALGGAAAAFSNSIGSMSNDISKFLNSSAYLKFRDAIDFLFRQANFVITGEMLVPTSAASKAGASRRAAEVAARAELRNRNMILKQEKINAEQRKKIQTEEEKRRRLELARKRAATIFDIENIQIVAALQGKIDGEQRARLVALLALNTENYKAAEKLADVVIRLNEPALSALGVMIEAGDSVDDLIKKLITSQAKLAALQLTAEDFPELDNPFEEWEDSLDSILKMLLELMNMTTKNKIQYTPLPPRPKTGVGSGASDVEWMRIMQQMQKAGIPYNPENWGESGLSAAVGSSATTNAPTNVNVYVSGNVTTENDLVARIAEQFYQQQKSGKQIVFSSTGL